MYGKNRTQTRLARDFDDVKDGDCATDSVMRPGIKGDVSDTIDGTNHSVIQEAVRLMLSEDIPESKSTGGVSKNWLVETTGADKEFDEQKTEIKRNTYIKTGFSKEYMQKKTRDLLKKVRSELRSWAELDKVDALIHISTIKDLLSDEFNFLSQSSVYRRFTASLMLIISMWQSLDKDQILAIEGELGKYISGEVSDHDIESFHKFMYKNGVNPFHDSK